MRKILAAKQIERDYIGPLKLTHGTLVEAAVRLLDDGFHCGIEPDDKLFELPPRLICTQQPSHISAECDTFTVILSANWAGANRSALYQSMVQARVSRYTTVCPYSDRSTSATQQPSERAEAEVAKYVSGLALDQRSVREAYEELLSKGFMCGVAGGADANRGSESAKLLCASYSPQLFHCQKIQVTLQIDSNKRDLLKQLFKPADSLVASPKVRSLAGICSAEIATKE